ncbi:MAG TPA: 5-formyltetrahydrofolate cyclo-ligase [Sediminibacterium sp.]|nr:5-formyltetrahydrofolate cyclo-ligase [Sediminibacterium sp.]
MTKQALRSLYRTLRRELDPREKMRMDALMLLQFQQLDYAGITTVLSYWPMPQEHEPDTHLFTRYLSHLFPGVQLAYPVTDPENDSMEAVAVSPSTRYPLNRWGIPEPATGSRIAPELIDLVLVPLLVCDHTGQRIGYGKGFYDRYLARCRPDVVKMGFCYFDPLAEKIPAGEFDVPLSYCITPRHLYEF